MKEGKRTYSMQFLLYENQEQKKNLSVRITDWEDAQGVIKMFYIIF